MEIHTRPSAEFLAQLPNWSVAQFAREIEKRRSEVDALIARKNASGSVTSDDRDRAEQILAELNAMGVESGVAGVAPVNKHPGFPRQEPSPLARGTRRGTFLDDDGRRIAKAWLDGMASTTPGGIRAALDGTSGGTAVPAYFRPGLDELPQRPVFVRDLIPSVQAQGDKADYLLETAATQNAAPVAAGATKPTSVYTIARKEAPIRVIAHVSEDLDRSIMDDIDLLTGFISGQLMLGLRIAEENEIIGGSGSGVHLTGILNTAGIQTQPFVPVAADDVRRADALAEEMLA